MSDDQSECDEKPVKHPMYSESTVNMYNGCMFKWTNFITGWCERYFILKDGLLSYYKSATEKDIGCRGAIKIQRAKIKLNPTDEFRFDVSVGDCVWYLRCLNKELRDEWIHALESHINNIDSAYGSDNSLRKTGSVLSLGSLSLCSSSRKSSSLRDKIAEIETYRDILQNQLETLQIYFDTQMPNNETNNDVIKENGNNVNDKADSSTKADDGTKITNDNNDSVSSTLPNTSKLNIKNQAPKLNPLMIKASTNLNFKQHQRHHSYSNPQFIHHNNSNQSKHHKRSFSHNSNNLEVLKNGSSINLYSDSQKSLNSLNSKFNNHQSLSSLDFKGEKINFKLTVDSLLESLNTCLEIMQQKEEFYAKRSEQDLERKKKLEELKLLTANDSSINKNLIECGPDYFEGPNSKIKEEEFFDALDAMLDKNDQQEEEKRQLKLRKIPEPVEQVEKCDHPLWPEIDKITLDQIYYARLEVGADLPSNIDSAKGWELFADEGEMRLYRREVEIDGLVCDPLKAVTVVKGITALEVCHHFFSPNVRWDWENTLESMKILEEINVNTLVLHQIHKRVWPAAQRDTLFWSHIRKVPLEDLSEEKDKENIKTRKPDDVWSVCNNSTAYIDVPLGRCLRMKMTVSMTCETYIDKPADVKEITRDHLKCKVIYCSQINPGGWCPSGVLRALYKREYPKFLKRFTQYVIDAQEGKPIMF